MSSPIQSSTLDGLPKQFVAAMRTLFDIMDDKRTGLVNFADIENRWQDDGSKGLPKGVLESLRKVTPPNGMLTFERFCAGLKICLLRNQVERRSDKREGAAPTNRPPSAPLLDIQEPPKQNWNTAAIRPNNVMSQQRTISMPQLLPKDPQGEKPVPNINKPLYGPPKPPRSAIGIDRGGNMDRAEIRTALQNWQMGLMMNDQENKTEKRPQYTGLLRTGRSLGDGKAAQSDIPVAPGMYQKKANVRRREPRRHTLQNGIDYNMLKRMKQIEQEKDVLMQGLNAVEKAREWYLKQVAAVQEKMKYLGRMGHVEPWSEAQQERLELQRARVFEVNRHLAALTDSWERGGLPLHMNLAVHHYPQNLDLNDRLKQQNRLLTEEVSKKSERISLLEREKANLIQMLQMRSAPNRNGQEEAVF
ncbi:Suppressor APC domain-containing protein 2-like Protein [Tribolium castaneum]|uniref:Suppressor APC domain-containing protein 2-like Protein n=1 Tax=Tribolium castaneum TaxID=7070 RepID=D7EJ90_TRICA|nr:PREDICTED: suppressor APC domain-containing protein 2 [Tribolium castaneum]EFA12609.1 Suppressor APC domain-containing protein 2-like Protein [Tribolium castaneum]|eukprot:XP_008195579.1 PREDICTED: suppressor APC domain-containing protein 2 [Tribolium castaneum]